MKNDDTDYHKKKRPRTKIPTNVIDNIPEGYELRIPASLIFKFFGDALKERFLKYPDKDGENN